MLKASSAEEAVAAAAGATSVGTQSEFSEMTGARGRARTSSKDKGALANNPNRAAAAGVGAGAGVARQPTTIATEADGSWARKTFS